MWKNDRSKRVQYESHVIITWGVSCEKRTVATSPVWKPHKNKNLTPIIVILIFKVLKFILNENSYVRNLKILYVIDTYILCQSYKYYMRVEILHLVIWIDHISIA